MIGKVEEGLLDLYRMSGASERKIWRKSGDRFVTKFRQFRRNMWPCIYDGCISDWGFKSAQHVAEVIKKAAPVLGVAPETVLERICHGRVNCDLSDRLKQLT